MVKTVNNPGGLPVDVFDQFRALLAADRASFYRAVASGPFYGFNRPGAKVLPAVVENWWRQGMMGGAKAHYDCIKAFSETDFTEDLKALDVPIFIAHGRHDPIGLLTKNLASQAESSTLFGASLSSTFLGSHETSVKILTVMMIIVMSATVFITQHQLMRRNMPKAALEGPMAKQQQIIIYLMPIFFAISGVNFPIGVLIYWFVTNVWTMGQQWFVIHRMPTPGSAAEKKLEERNRAKGREHKTVTMDDLRKANEGKPKGRFAQAMEKAQEQAREQQAVGAPPPTAPWCSPGRGWRRRR